MLVVLAAGAQPARAQAVLMPGETRHNIPAAGQIIQVQHGNEFGDARSWAEVTFERADAMTQNMKLIASHPVRALPVYGTAIARGMLYLDFCVPTPGAAECVSDPSASDVTATITFGYGIVGRVSALGLTAKATFQATASILDLHDSRTVNFLELANESASQGSIKTIMKVPLPVPAFAGASITRPGAFTTTLKRGRMYRFRLAAAATTTKGLAQPLAVTLQPFALADFSRPLPGFQDDGFVQLHNLTISVSSDAGDLIDSLQGVVKSLQDQILNLVEQIEGVRSAHEEDVAALRQELAELRLATIGAGPVACNTLPPGQGWLCVNGGWLPPGHPSAGGGDGPAAPPVPPPPSPAACLGTAPATGWVCVNGGWVPPDHPLARGGG
jgi:hypothetical protein